ncbi:putative snRNA-activating protein complex subunit 4 [Paratrimastix pyriformis]|uniref:snRNA-activating protein complex subunit 4 n=1 Tax=Paratrimastix pyriformis TaxID=342808 RepID=A0ABQ8UTU8_9EUKA|nr:putative snRNA-activating protein complex subunit 4 [Paratrimastix pyriformis]
MMDVPPRQFLPPHFLPPHFLPPHFLPPHFLPPHFLPPHFLPPHFLPPHFLPPHFLPPHFLPPHFLPPHFLPPQFLPPQFLPPQFLPPQFLPPQFLPPQFLPPQFLPPQFLPPQFLPPQFLPPQFLPPQFLIRWLVCANKPVFSHNTSSLSVPGNVEVAYLRSSFCKGAVESSFVVATGMTIGELRAQHENQMIFVPNENPTADSLGIAPADIELVRPSTHYVLAEPFTLYTFMVDAQPYIPRQRRGGSLRCTLRLLATEQNFRAQPQDSHCRPLPFSLNLSRDVGRFRLPFSVTSLRHGASPVFRWGGNLPMMKRARLAHPRPGNPTPSVTLHPATPIVFEDFGMEVPRSRSPRPHAHSLYFLLCFS